MRTLKTSNLDKLNQTTSKGAQIKFTNKDHSVWYKLDDLGYEGISEVIASRFAKCIQLDIPFVTYYPQKFEFDYSTKYGCSSKSFTSGSYEEYSAYLLIEKIYDIDLASVFNTLNTPKDKIHLVVSCLEKLNGLIDIGKWLSLVLQFDYLILNEDRHLFNILFLYNPEQDFYKPAPLFDNGQSLLSDIKNDYPINMPLEVAIRRVKSKPFSTNFKKQVNAVKDLYNTYLYLPPVIELDVSDLYTEYNSKYTDRACAVLEYQINKLYPATTISFIKNNKDSWSETHLIINDKGD